MSGFSAAQQSAQQASNYRSSSSVPSSGGGGAGAGAGGGGGGSLNRKERGAIAAQACETCRGRKQKCDEQRPKCGTCQRFKLQCNYREPQPTKKDRTLVEILERIKGLEGKIDSLNFRGGLAVSDPFAPVHHADTTGSPTSPLAVSAAGFVGPLPAAPFHHVSHEQPSGEATSGVEGQQYKYVSSVHAMMRWPAIQQLLSAQGSKIPGIDLSSVERDGPAICLGIHGHNTHSLPANTPLTTSFGQAMQGPSPRQMPLASPPLDWDTMQRLSKAYFDTFNLMFPILARQSFVSDTLRSVFNDGFGQGVLSTVAFLVFALGEVAIAGSEGAPLHVYNGRPSGVRGGSRDQPPGLALFNEARKRMGFNLTECSLENVQIFALASVYYASCFRHMGFWRMTASASLACQALITSNPSELSSPRADLIRRAFWHCSIMETCLNLELGFPTTGLERLESVVGLPDFSGPFCEDDYMGNQGSNFREHFASQIVLRRLLVDFHAVLSQADTLSPPGAGAPQLNQNTMRQLALQLEQWRGMLPAQLRWQEESPGAFPNPGPEMFTPNLYSPASTHPPLSSPVTNTGLPSASTLRSSPAVAPTTRGSVSTGGGGTQHLTFTTDLDAPPTTYPYGLDIQVALLRSRYYYTKFLIHRPFVYKALHFPDAMTHDDAAGVAECLKASLKWPLAMSPPCTRKRLLPCTLFFSQNLLGILVLLHLSTTVPILRRIRSTLCGERFEIDAGETVGLYLDWLRDLREVDRAARWCWDVAGVMYGLDEGVQMP